MQDALFRFGLSQGLCQADAAEAVQETFLRAYRARLQWRKGGDAVAWLYGVAMNVVREARRRTARRLIADVDLVCLPDGKADSPDRRLSLEPLLNALDALPPRQREAVACRYIRQMSVRETAEAMGCAEGTVKAAAHAGLENLRKLLREP